ncbi:hypothetical protein D3C81_1694300 [compost metagenome]
MLLQPGGEGAGQLVQLAVAEGAAEIAEGGLVGEALAGLAQHGEDVRVAVGVDLGSDPCGVFVGPEMFVHRGSLPRDGSRTCQPDPPLCAGHGALVISGPRYHCREDHCPSRITASPTGKSDRERKPFKSP